MSQREPSACPSPASDLHTNAHNHRSSLLKNRSPAVTAPRIVSGPTLLTGICFCADSGRAMALRTGKSGRYRYYTCSTKARQGETGCMGRTVPMEKLDTLVADHIERRLLQPARLEQILSSVLDRREERAERRTAHIAALRKRAAETDASSSGSTTPSRTASPISPTPC
jgi:site-specific DNA recombinase